MDVNVLDGLYLLTNDQFAIQRLRSRFGRALAIVFPISDAGRAKCSKSNCFRRT